MEKTPHFGPSLSPKKLKKLTGAIGCMHKAPKCIQSLWDHPKKIPFVQKYKESAICEILRKNPILGHSQRLKKVFLSAQSVCARLRTGPIIMQIPRGYQKNSLLCRKSAILSIRWKKPPFWGLPSGPKKLKKLTGALGCMHKAPKCIQSLWDHPKEIPFVQKYKESAICAILREKTPFWRIPRGSKRCSYLRNLSTQGCALAQ